MSDPKVRHLSPLDMFLNQADRALRTLSPDTQVHARPSPSQGQADTQMSDEQRQHAAGLMRVNHTGEVMAQALYQGQALTAKLPKIRAEMEHAANEEIDHLAWCEERLEQLGSRPSRLAPLWYAGSYSIGVLAGLAGDKWSLGFIEETEKQVTAHLESHLTQLPEKDNRSRTIIEKMREDEIEHAESAHNAGAMDLPPPIKHAMTQVAKVMTKASFKI